MGILDDLLGGAGNTPWAQQQMAQMLGQTPAIAPAPQVAAPLVAPIPETPLGTQPSGAAPAPAPAQYPFQQDPGGPDGGDFLAALLSGAGGPIGNLGKMMLASSQAEKARQQDRLQKNATYQFFKKRGLDDDMAAMAVLNPEVGKSVLGTLFGPKKGPQLVEIPDQYGNPRKYAVDPNTGNLVDPSTLIQGAPQIAPGAAPAPVAPGMMVTPAPSAEPPAGLPGNPMGGPTSGIVPPASTQLGTQPDVEVGQPQVVSQPQASMPAGTVAGPAYRGKLPDGMVQRLGPNGEFLYERTPSGLAPAMMPKAELDAIAKARGESGAAREEEKRVAQQFLGGINRFKQLAMDFGDQALERSIGPYVGGVADPEQKAGLWGSGISLDSAARLIARGVSELQALEDGGAAPTEVRDRIETTGKNLAAVMKPLVRKPGEGVWTDKDQINLEKSLGDLTRARSKEEYDRRLNDIVENVKNVFMIAVPDDPGPTGRSPNAPPRAEDVNTIFEDGLIGRLFGGNKPTPEQMQQPGIQQVYELLRKQGQG